MAVRNSRYISASGESRSLLAPTPIALGYRAGEAALLPVTASYALKVTKSDADRVENLLRLAIAPSGNPPLHRADDLLAHSQAARQFGL